MRVGQDPTDAKLRHVRALTAAGFALFPLRGKRPAVGGWQNTTPGEYDETRLSAPGVNYGVVLPSDVLVVDVDPRNFKPGDQPVARLTQAIGTGFKSYTVRTGSGGYHIYLRKPPDFETRVKLKEYPGIDFKREGGYVVGPGSVHPDTGQAYEVVGDITDPKQLTDAPEKMLALLEKTSSGVEQEELKAPDAEAGDETNARYRHYLENVAEPSVEGKGGDDNAFKVACRGRDLGLPVELTLALMKDFWNPRCSPPWDGAELREKVNHAYKYAAGTKGGVNPKAVFDEIKEKPKAPPSEDLVSWNLSSQGRVLKTFHNLMNFFKASEYGLLRVFAYNDFTGRVEFVSPAPWHAGKMPRVASVGDADLKLLKGYLSTRCGYEASIQDIEGAVTNVAYHHRFHPVREYLDGLEWDGKERLDTWLRDFCGVEDSPYSRACARKTICAAVMRVYRPGVKFDHVLLLEGNQDVGKSTIVEILGGEWSADSPVHPHAKDTIDMMQGRWIIELAELEVARRADEDALKAFITRRTDRARLAYGRTTSEFPRQSIFIATKNPRADGTYLKDETGNRRWWPVRCEPKHGVAGYQVNFKGLKEARDQLFAEAVARMKRKPGEKLFMETRELKSVARAEAQKRYVAHEWTDAISSWIAMCDQKEETRRDFLTTREVFRDALGGGDRLLDRKASLGIAQVMRQLEWTPDIRRRHGFVSRGYSRPAPGGENRRSDEELLGEL